MKFIQAAYPRPAGILLVLCSCMAERLDQPQILAGYDGAGQPDAGLRTDAPERADAPVQADASNPLADVTATDAAEDTTTTDLPVRNADVPVNAGDTDPQPDAKIETTLDVEQPDAADATSVEIPDAASADTATPTDSVEPPDAMSPDTSNDTQDSGTPDTPIPSCGTCDDKNPCSKDECVAGSCQHSLLTAVACDDGNACTKFDACSTGKCSGTKVFCDDGIACTKDACVPASGCTVTTDDKVCDDGNPCSTDACTTKGCTHTNTGTGCNDGDVCTSKDACVGLACAGTAVNCDDGNSCTKDACVPKGGCSFTNLDGVCSDGDACTSQDTCKFGSCVAGKKLDCDDKNPCTVDSCGLAGCSHKAAANGTTCGAGVVCQDGTCSSLCGNGKVDPGEQCDDGNKALCDGCEQCNIAQHVMFKTPGQIGGTSGAALAGVQSATVELWVRLDQKPAGDDGNGYAASTLVANGAANKTGSIHLYIQIKIDNPQARKLCVNIYGNTVHCYPHPTELAKWHHVALTITPGNMALFVDGKLLGTQGRQPGPVGAEGQGVQLGFLPPNTNYFLGGLDEVRLSKIARYQDNFTPQRRFQPDKDTWALWHLDSPVNGSAFDSSGNNHHLTLNDNTFVADSCYGAAPDAAACGDGKKAIFEACDDGNTKDGDGCSSTCNIQ